MPAPTPGTGTEGGSSKSSFSSEHARLLAAAGVACPAEGPGPYGNTNVPFTVVEEKPSGLRQRFILWTREANKAAKEGGYVPHVPLGHIGRYLAAVRDETASLRDVKTSFYQVEIPAYARHLFRFVDEAGSWWELTRLPMGHTCAPEIMQWLSSVVAGDPAIVLPRFASRRVRVEVWIDNIRLSGTKAAVDAATKQMDATAAEADMQWKEADCRTSVTHYDFLGVLWNHRSKCVQVGAKTLTRLVCSPVMTAGEIEALGGRLLFAGAVAGVKLAPHYFAVKWLRRVVASVNAGRRSLTDPVDLPPSILHRVQKWIAEASRSQTIPAGKPASSWQLFVDASRSGWGVVLASSSGEVRISGAQWDEHDQSLHINVLEAKALVQGLQALPEEGVAVDVFVDSTTVQGSWRKAFSPSAPLNGAIAAAHDVASAKNLSLALRWIASGANPADAPSRQGSPADVVSRLQEFWRCGDGRVTGGVAVATPPSGG